MRYGRTVQGGINVANYIPGMASGFDWTSMITQLMALERRPIELLETNKEKINDRYDAWTGVNTKLLSLKTAAQSLSAIDDFNLYTSSASITGTDDDVDDLLSYSVGTNASQGSYTLTVNNLAQAQKLGSTSFSAFDEALSISGDIVINGRVVNIASTNTLSDIRNKINDLNSGENPAGVTASIFTSGDGEYRLTLTSQNTGADGISIANGSSTNVLGLLGIADSTTSLGSVITDGAQSSRFTSSTQDMESLLGLNTPASDNVRIEGVDIAIDLGTDSLQSIRDKINLNGALQAQGISASIVSETEDDTVYYRLQIDGTQSFTDADNILQTLGVLKLGHSDVMGITGSANNTANGQVITEDTLIGDMDGYNQWTSGDTITIQGTDHSGAAIGPIDFTIDATSTVSDFLDAVEGAFSGNVNAYINGDGALIVEDNQSGASLLTMTLTSNITDPNSSLSFGAFGIPEEIRKRQITAGEDSQITLDGATITRSTNQITDVIAGVTLNLRDEDDAAEITLNVSRDYDGIKENISNFIKAYNDIIDFVSKQFEYDTEDENAKVPPLFGDASLLTVKSSIRDVIQSGINGLSASYDHLSLIGVNMDKTGKLSIDNTKLDGYLRTNFTDVVNLFTAQGSSTNTDLTYVSSEEATGEGSYEVEITQAASQANTTGVGFGGTLNADSTVSITDNWGREAIISLSSGWNITSVVNAINSELSKEYEEIQVGANRYYSDAGHTTAITASTALNSVYNGAGASANLADGDEISFSGTDRAGNNVSGSFTITDASSDTVGDLLLEIEDAYGSGYDAYLDSQGRIAIKDMSAGDSDLTLSITPVKDLDFGVIDIDPTGADGSHAGRYSMNMSAENSGGQLKISNDDYGDYSFTIAVAGGNLGITNNTYTGTDVGGRIRGEGSGTWMTMTGSGRTLTVDDDQGAEGLVVKYTGSSTGILDFQFTVGVGEKMDRSLYYMTDAFEGFISDKQTSMKDQMESIDEKIENVEKRLAQRETNLIAKFVVMERLISQLQSQQSRMSSQISSLTS